ncbi:Biofilm regulatory protein A precursor [Nocardioides dokdonensis FR1436]|uniref:Biofilm regulatory protein A n=1 Tax=Nocardioides dokdonensis FR1436 TaxID=1300347 RepID=A0A1A9GPY4_9ACTN|nr:Biofilm regulatory protein A precursor [Nocardioides dokdonensis FR1436]
MRRRAQGLPGTLGVTLLGAVLPGSGFVWTGRRLLGLVVLLPTLGALAYVVGYLSRGVADLRTLLDLALDPTRLKTLAVLAVVGLLVWAVLVWLTYRQARPVRRSRWATAAGNGFVVLLVVLVGAPLGMAARYASVQADLVETVFEEAPRSATIPRDVTEADPWGGRDRVNLLLLGGDGSDTRTGVRTDSLILASIETATGKTVMFSLPRNLMYAQFPEDSPLHALYPDGFTGGGDPAAYMLNAVYGQVPALHPGVLGDSSDEGADALKQAVGGSLGLDVDYYVLVNLRGFEQVVDAIGGITVNVNEPVAINGNTDAGIPPTGWIEPGPDQELDGFHALWYARGRYGSDDYRRMERQRCAVDAIIDAADPMTLLRRYTDLAEAGMDIVTTDIPRSLLPAFVELGLEMKDAKVRSVVFKPSERFSSGDPDYDFVRATVAKALDPPERSVRKADPDRARNTENSCAYTGADLDELEAGEPDVGDAADPVG